MQCGKHFFYRSGLQSTSHQNWTQESNNQVLLQILLWAYENFLAVTSPLGDVLLLFLLENFPFLQTEKSFLINPDKKDKPGQNEIIPQVCQSTSLNSDRNVLERQKADRYRWREPNTGLGCLSRLKELLFWFKSTFSAGSPVCRLQIELWVPGPRGKRPGTGTDLLH